MAHHLKYKRMTVNVPIEFAEAVQKRIEECPYGSESAYFMGLTIFDLWSRRKHRLTVKLMAQKPEIRDAAIDRIGADYLAGKTGRQEPGWFDQYIKQIVDEEIAKAAVAKGEQPEPKNVEELAEPTSSKEAKEPRKPTK